MADFCKQCSEYLFGFDSKDFAGLNPEIVLNKDEGFKVLCEGCGEVILVDHDGQRIDKENWKHP